MFCPKCGNSLNEGAEFCPMCGTRIARKENVESVITMTDSGNAKNEKKSKKKWLIIVGIIVLLSIAVGIKVSYDNAKKNRVATFQLEGYTITVPYGYTVTHSEKEVLVLNNEEGYGITFNIFENTDNNTVDFIKQNAEKIASNVYNMLGLDPFKNGGITSVKDCSIGEFNGAYANYYVADADLRVTMITTNNKDMCLVNLYGMQNPQEVIRLLKVTH